MFSTKTSIVKNVLMHCNYCSFLKIIYQNRFIKCHYPAINVSNWSISSNLRLIVHLKSMHLLLCKVSVVGFGWLIVGLCARLGTASTVCSTKSFTLKYFKGCAYFIRQEEKIVPGR